MFLVLFDEGEDEVPASTTSTSNTPSASSFKPPTCPSTPIIKEEFDIPVQFPQTPADNQTPPALPSPAPAPLPRPRVPAVPPEPPGLRRSTRTKNHPGE